MLSELTSEAEVLTNGGAIAIAAYAAHQLAKFVLAVTMFLSRLEKAWEQETKHRASEIEHWESEKSHHSLVVSLLDKIKANLTPRVES